MASVKLGAVDRVAVVGAGPAGLAAAKYLAAEKAFSKIVVFEQRHNFGGVWNATPTIAKDETFKIPNTDPSSIPSEPVREDGKTGGITEFLSPIYNDLDTNLIHRIMSYSDHFFPANTPLFPHHSAVLEYLERYADEIRPLLQLGTQVLDVRSSRADQQQRWSVTTRDVKTQEQQIHTFDAIVVANGHYNDPYIPDIPGIRDWNEAYPGRISHSKFYRRPEGYRDKKVLIIGNSASGTDIASQLAPFVTPPLLISIRSPSKLVPADPSLILSVPEIAEFHVKNAAVHFKPTTHRGSGAEGCDPGDSGKREAPTGEAHPESNIDHLIFCTGYKYSFPFLSSLPPPINPSISVPDGSHVQNLYKHIFYIANPTLCFLTLPQRIVPFPFAEAQASVVARVLAGRISLPSADVMQQDGEEGKEALLLEYPRDVTYIRELVTWAGSAESKPGFNKQGIGKELKVWGEELCWVREHTFEIKKRAMEKGAGRRDFRTLEELGFVWPGRIGGDEAGRN